MIDQVRVPLFGALLQKMPKVPLKPSLNTFLGHFRVELHTQRVVVHKRLNVFRVHPIRIGQLGDRFPIGVPKNTILVPLINMTW